MENSITNSNSYGYAVSGKIMLSAIIVLFTVVIALVCLHLYARWYLQRARRRHNLRRRNQRTNTTSTHHIFYVDPNNNPNGVLPIGSNHGLDASVLKSLPVFVYGSEETKELMVVECAVCLSEFEDKEMMRCLPKCNHCFHIGCIDMWFHSHSTCPLCRSPVESDHRFQSSSTGTGSVDVAEVAVTVNESVVVDTTTTDSIGSSSGFCSSCKHDEGEANSVRSSSSSSSMFGMRRKPSLVLPIEIPRRSDDDFRAADSPSSASQSYKSPVGRIRSFRRMLSRGIPSPSSGAETSCGPSELDIEQGRDRLTPRNRVETPR